MISSYQRWLRVGHSNATPADGRPEAGRAAAAAAGIAMDGPDPRLLVVFAPAGYPAEEIAEAVGDVAGGVPFLGTSTTGHIGSGGPPDDGVVVVGLGGDVAVETTCGTEVNRRPREVGAEIGQALHAPAGPEPRLVLMLTDNLATDQQELIRGAYSAFGAGVPMVGAVSGYGVEQTSAWQLYHGKVLQDAVVAASLTGDLPIGISVKHGWQRAGAAMLATASADNHVYTLDDRPALEVYLERLAAPAGIEHDMLAFRDYALSRPLAISRRGEVAIRHVIGAIPADGVLVCAAAIPRGATVWLGTTDAGSTLGAAEDAMAEAVASLGGAPAQGLLVFDCSGRRAVLLHGIKDEWRRMRAGAGDVPIAGFYGNGEIARIRGAYGYHNQTIVACAIG
jgi:hypothetical protein